MTESSSDRSAALDALEEAGGWANADTGWKGNLSSEERLTRRAADTAEAQVYATLAVAETLGRIAGSLDGLLGESEATRSAVEGGLSEIRDALEATDTDDFVRLDRTLDSGLGGIRDEISDIGTMLGKRS
jgi:hypothetical protein